MKNIFHVFLFIYFSITAGAAPTKTLPKGDRDFKTFLYALNLAADEPSPSLGDAAEISNLQRLAQREMSVADMTTQELYERFNQVLVLIQPSLKKLYAAKQAMQAGTFDREIRCLEIGCTAGFFIGVGIRLSIGIVHTPQWSYPTFGLRIKFNTSQGSEGMAGAAIEIGAEKVRSAAENSDLRVFATIKGVDELSDWLRVVGLGYYTTSSSEGHEAKGVAIGLAGGDATLNELRTQIPLKIPLYYFNYEKPLLKKLHTLMRTLYFFDFERADLLANEFNIQTERTLVELQKRGLRTVESSSNLPEHPLVSPGVLFHPRTLQRYAPKELIPVNLAMLDCEKAASQKGPGLLGFSP